MSYHNGSVWPHDNSLIALGFARYGLKSHALKLFRGLSDAASHTDLRRLPELFCGFVRREHAGPTFYPTACAPQAWASGSFFALLQACLGLNLDQRNNEIKFHQPVLPHFIEELRLRDLKLGDNHVDVTLRNHAGSMTVDVVRRTGDVRVLVLH